MKTPSLKVTKPYTLEGVSNQTISGLSINVGDQPGITLKNCINIHITKSTFQNATGVQGVGIWLINCTNVTIDACRFNAVASGVFVSRSTKVYIAFNDMLNMKGPMPRGQFVQFVECYGDGNKIMNNRLENISGQSNPEDAINIFNSNGTADSPITIAYNKIRGGGPSNTGGGIVLGDAGGSYQSAFENILINPGQYGMSVASGMHMTISDNIIYGAQAPFTNVGLFAWNQYPFEASDITIKNNRVNFTAAGGYKNSSWNAGNCGNIAGWETNKFDDPTLTEDILPAKFVNI